MNRKNLYQPKCNFDFYRGASVAAGLTIAAILQTEGRYLDLPVNSRITYDRVLREIGSNLVFGAYAAERYKPLKTSDSSCKNDAVLKQLLNEYQGRNACFSFFH